MTSVYTDQCTTTAAATSRADQAYVALKRSLLVGDHPLGSRLAEERLARDLGVSRTPVREALARLHSERLVARLPDGGYGPTAPDFHASREVYELRLGLERLALLRPSTGGPPQDESALRSLHATWSRYAEDPPDPEPSFVLLDEDFHLALAMSAGNQAVVSALATANEHIRPLRMHDFLTAERVITTIRQHLDIADALLAGRPAAADAVLTAHLRESMDVVEDRAAQALARMVNPSRKASPVPSFDIQEIAP